MEVLFSFFLFQSGKGESVKNQREEQDPQSPAREDDDLSLEDVQSVIPQLFQAGGRPEEQQQYQNLAAIDIRVSY